MYKFKTYLNIIGLVTSLLNLSCQSANTTEALLISAQTCLDKLPQTDSANALNCVAAINDLTTPQASILKCSALFIKQGFSNPEKLTQISEQMKNSGSNSNDSTFVVIGLLSFTGADKESEAAKALEACSKSGSKGMTMLASLSSIATSAGQFANIIDKCTAEGAVTSDCATEVRDGVCGAESASLGQIAITTYQISCSGDDLTNPMCQVYKEATLNGTDTNSTTVGNRLQTYLNQENACP